MFRTNVSRGITFVLIVLIIVLAAMAYGWVESGQFTWQQVAQMYIVVTCVMLGFGVGIWWVSKGEGWDG